MEFNSHDIVSNPYAQSLIQIKARQLCRRADFSGSDLEDLHQCMRMHLLKMGHHFDPRRAGIETFIARVLNSCVAMILRDRRRDKRRANLQCASLEGTEQHRDGESVALWSSLAPEDQHRRTGTTPRSAVDDFDLSEAFAFALNQLTDDDRAIALLVIDRGKTGAARSLGVSRRQIDNVLARMRQPFIDAGLAHDPNANAPRPSARHK